MSEAFSSLNLAGPGAVGVRIDSLRNLRNERKRSIWGTKETRLDLFNVCSTSDEI